MQLSEHLSLAEVTRSETAKRKGISNMPTDAHLENFKLLAEKVFEPIRKHFGKPIHISSGYRSAAFNAVSLALMDAGIAMRDFVVATTAGLLGGNVAVMDLIYEEEKRQNCEFVLVYLLPILFGPIASVNLFPLPLHLIFPKQIQLVATNFCVGHPSQSIDVQFRMHLPHAFLSIPGW